MSERFDGEELTARLQDAVKAHDGPTLDQLVSDRLLFASGRRLGRMGKAGFIDAALRIEWYSFAIYSLRVVELDAVGIVDYELQQDAVAEGHALVSDWVVTDVWHRTTPDRWQLVARHPEPASVSRP